MFTLTFRHSFNNIVSRGLITVACSGLGKFSKTPSTFIYAGNEAIKGKYGDDACFISKCRNGVAFGVADGVGGWRTQGIDPSKFTHGFINHIADASSEYADELSGRTPLNLVLKSIRTLREGNASNFTGSSTFCILVFDEKNIILHTANFGDSGFLIVRNRKTFFKSPELQSHFNAPYQIGLTELGEIILSEDLRKADINSFHLKANDIIVLGTDGLWDNFPVETIVSYLTENKICDVRQISEEIVLRCEAFSRDSKYQSPFAKKVEKIFGHKCTVSWGLSQIRPCGKDLGVQ